METGNQVGYQKLVAWQLADEFAWAVYQVTYKFPKEEVFGITSQLRRAVLSIVLNIVEGHSRNARKEFKRFLNISLGSLAEVDYILKFSYKLGYLSEVQFNKLSEMRIKCGKVLWSLMQSQ
jgi:four helix bundle protein